VEHGAHLLQEVWRFEHPADATVARYFREHRSLGPRERQTLSDAVYAVLRDRPRLDWWLGQNAAASKPPGPAHARLLVLLVASTLRAGASEAERPALERALERALQRAQSAQGPEMPPEVAHALPAWLAERLQSQNVPGGLPALADALRETAPLDLRVNVLKARRPAVLQALADAGFSAAPTAYSPLGIRVAGKPSLKKLPLFTEGWVEVQDEGSQLLTLLVGARRNEMVADFCAGAGGKTLALAAAMRNTGRLYAFDTSAHRLEALQPRLQRAGALQVHPMALAHERDERLNRLAGKLDRVLVDAPCSGLGTLRRSPDLKWRQSVATLADMPALQTRILASAARLLKPGGRLVYATCSLLEEENEAVADAFTAAHHRDFVPLDAAECLEKAGAGQPQGLTRAGKLRLWPHVHGTDGFFAAIWQRKP
jgi:16S rRNA (cytosine967-C5)-methyltransferase